MCKDLKNLSLRRLILPSDSTLINIWWLVSWLATIAILVAFVWYLVTDHQSLTVVDFHIVENFGETLSYVPPPVAAAAVTAMGGLISSLVGANSANSTNALNYRMMQEQNQFNAGQAHLNREWQDTMLTKQWNRETDYNDPQNQMARLKQAGINPFMAAEGVAGFGQTHSPSAPSGAQASASQTIPMQNPWANFGQNFTNFAEIAKAWMEAKKASAEGDKASTEGQILSEGMESTLRTMLANAETAEHEAYIANIRRSFEQLRQTKEVEQIEEKTLEIISQRELNAAQKEERISQMWKNLADSAKTSEEANQIRLLTPVIVGNAKKEGLLIDAKRGTEYATQHELHTRSQANIATAAKNYADAKKALEEAKTEADLRGLRGTLLNRQISLTTAEMTKLTIEAYDTYKRLGMDEKLFVPRLKELEQKIYRGEIQATKDFIDVLFEPLQKVHDVSFGSGSQGTVIPFQ